MAFVLLSLEKISKRKKWLILLAISIVLIIWTAWGNTALGLSTYTIESEKIPQSFDGFRIAQVADLHNAEMGEGNKKLLEMLKKAEPDIIVITGDLIDSRRTDIEVALQFVEQAVEIAPCYYVTGNHESRLAKQAYQEFETAMCQSGVQVLHDEEVVVERDGYSISIVGVDDISFAQRYGRTGCVGESNKLRELFSATEYKILLSHRPELFPIYVDANVDLVFAGHAHGGQLRFPFIGGIFAPNQGFFPEYDAGVFRKDGTNMVVSRGIGNSIFPLRFNNRPELIVVELSKITSITR